MKLESTLLEHAYLLCMYMIWVGVGVVSGCIWMVDGGCTVYLDEGTQDKSHISEKKVFREVARLV